MHTSPFPDTALLCLSVMAQLFERKTNPQQLRHLSGKGSEAFDETDILRAAGVLDLKAKAIQSEERRKRRCPRLPVRGTALFLFWQNTRRIKF